MNNYLFEQSILLGCLFLEFSVLSIFLHFFLFLVFRASFERSSMNLKDFSLSVSSFSHFVAFNYPFLSLAFVIQSTT